MSKMKLNVILFCLYFFQNVLSIDVQERSNSRDARKLFGGYRITPRFCKPTRRISEEMKGPNICMFNHECIQRNGLVVGACMDGFLFGACCQLHAGTAGELIDSDDDKPVYSPDNDLYGKPFTKSPNMGGHITSSGLSQISSTLLHGVSIPTAHDNIIVQVNEQDQFAAAGVTHPTAPDTYVVNQFNDINPDDFLPSSEPAEDRKTTLRVEDTTHAYIPDVSPFIQISISNAPPYYTPSPLFQKPIFRPKPQKPSDADKYVLVQTINHAAKNKTENEIESIVNIIQMLNESSTNSYNGGQGYTVTTTRKPPSTSYVFSATTTKRPGYDSNSDRKTTSRKPPSSYSYAPTTATRKTTTTKTKATKRPTKPTKTTSKKPNPTIYGTTSKKPVYQYVSSSTFRPGQTTFGNTYYTTKRPPSTSYVYSSTPSKRPTTLANVAGPGYTVTKTPSQYATYPSPPTLIVLGSFGPTEYTTSNPPSKYASSTTNTSKRPVAVTINNHITQNIYSSTERPSPTVLITPKPSATSTAIDENTVEVGTSADDLINFPPVRNPNLNMSIPVFDESDITTPEFIEDDVLNTKVESFVNKIIEGLQEPFEGLKDVVYNKNKTAFLETTSKKPIKKQGTKKPTSRPSSVTTSGRPTTKRPTSAKRPTQTTATKKSTTVSTTTSKRTRPTKRVTTTPQSFIEEADEGTTDPSSDYRSQCGIRPLMKSGRIVGGKGASFGEFPWQVLVRESTWLGLFTKNKCGGVLISNRYVMTAAHCQPGFLASLVAVFGEFDISGDLETKRSISRNVKRVIVHRQYDAATFENDLALLELEHPVIFDQHIVPICLPRDHEDFTSRMATVTGWGRLKYGGGVPSVLQEVQVPIMENSVCQEMFRTAGHSKVILESFLCAGYANGQKDSCEGDSGGPLVLQRPDGRYQLAGTVSHGIKCAAPYLPGVYMRTTYYKPWIESITGVH